MARAGSFAARGPGGLGALIGQVVALPSFTPMPSTLPGPPASRDIGAHSLTPTIRRMADGPYVATFGPLRF